MVVHPIPQWEIPSWDCMKRLWRSPMLSGLLHQGVCWRISPASFFLTPLHLLWAWLELGSHFYQNNDLFLYIRCKWCDQCLFWVSAPYLFRCLRRPQFSRAAHKWVGFWPWLIGNLCKSSRPTLWAVDDKLISMSAVVVHWVIFLDQAKWQDVRYTLGAIPYRIRISREVANFVGVCHSCITMDT